MVQMKEIAEQQTPLSATSWTLIGRRDIEALVKSDLFIGDFKALPTLCAILLHASTRLKGNNPRNRRFPADREQMSFE